MLMTDRVWEFVQSCWKYDVSERPAVKVIADILARMNAESPNALDSENDEVAPLESSAEDIPPSIVDEERQAAVVRFGPLDHGVDYKAAFSGAFEALCALVKRRSLTEPHSIHPHDVQYLDLHFRSVMEANNFAMTWTVHRVELYPKCAAVLVNAG
ncbi:hypothetical protein K438DRAFT_1144384 [Mycena galopus ATCC 62051]|nr:hypothetical protein K438DRAFT_1144384 [Mycena galopus ATCC 62051]